MGIRGGPGSADSLLGRGLPPQGRRGGVSRPRGSGARAGAALPPHPPPPPPGAGSGFVPSRAGWRAAPRCLRPRGELWKPGFPRPGRAPRPKRRAPRPPCLSFPHPGRGRSADRLERSRTRGSRQVRGREVSFLEIQVVVLQRRGSLPGAGFPACHFFPSSTL